MNPAAGKCVPYSNTTDVKQTKNKCVRLVRKLTVVGFRTNEEEEKHLEKNNCK